MAQEFIPPQRTFTLESLIVAGQWSAAQRPSLKKANRNKKRAEAEAGGTAAKPFKLAE